MLNKEPILIYGFARGGSNIIMNLVLSHPNVCLTNGETHKVFKGTRWDSPWRVFMKKLFADVPVRVLAGQNLFNPYSFDIRKPVPDYLMRYIDRILYQGRFLAMVDTHNRWKYENVEYTIAELQDCRLLTKGLAGLAFTVDMFGQMYPDATFLGLARNGLALCEGFVRRGYSAEEVAQMYKSVGRQIYDSAERLPNYHLFYYEDMVADPMAFMNKIYTAAGLDIDEVKKVRLQSKGIMQADGKRVHLRGKDREVFWHDKQNLHQFIKGDVNSNQIDQLKPADKNTFISIAGEVMEMLGYPTE